ncbi:cytochrome P450 [Amylostereum chailletii]|nr:cytochrome P450 [Amylostereum chailletii]
MPGHYLEALLVALVVGLSTAICRAYLKHRRIVILTPPSPWPLPLVGNLFDIPSSAPWKAYAAWSKLYQSDLISVRAFGQLTIVVNTRTAARELFEVRSGNFSDRPRLAMIELSGWEWITGMMPYNDAWRTRRRILHQYLHEKTVSKYHPTQLDKARQLVCSLHDDPSYFKDHIRTFAASIAMSIAYGYDVKPREDRFVAIAEKAVHKLSLSTFPGAQAVNAFPILTYLPEWFPGAGFHTFAKESRQLTEKMRKLPIEFVQHNMVNGTEAHPSVIRSLIEANQKLSDVEDDARVLEDVGGVIYSAGADTTVSALMWCILALVMHPEVQRRAQAEIDSIIGRDRLPNHSDRTSLPYVDAVYREALRWNPVIPLGVTRSAMKSDMFQGHLIPEGTIMVYNTWAIMHDPKTYQNPDSFIPERFLNPDGTLNDDDVQAVFGYSRRICSGMHLAKSSVWLAIASILALFDITKAKDEQGNDIPVSVGYIDGFLSHPLPYACTIKARDARAAEMLDAIKSSENETC